jgi:hypothetical protein
MYKITDVSESLSKVMKRASFHDGVDENNNSNFDNNVFTQIQTVRYDSD